LGLALAGSVVAWCAGCGNEAPPEATVSKAAPKAAPKAEASVDAALGAPFVYSPVGKRDPFRSYLVELSETSVDHGPSRKKEDTEEFEIDQYRLTGLITGIAQPKAMVEDPQGRGHVMHIGSRMGKNGGRVSRISNFGIVVVEETRDPTGKKVRLPITIKLPKSEYEDVVQD
jgi:type IV pilus assembly protein PilP